MRKITFKIYQRFYGEENLLTEKKFKSVCFPIHTGSAWELHSTLGWRISTIEKAQSRLSPLPLCLTKHVSSNLTHFQNSSNHWQKSFFFLPSGPRTGYNTRVLISITGCLRRNVILSADCTYVGRSGYLNVLLLLCVYYEAGLLLFTVAFVGNKSWQRFWLSSQMRWTYNNNMDSIFIYLYLKSNETTAISTNFNCLFPN